MLTQFRDNVQIYIWPLSNHSRIVRQNTYTRQVWGGRWKGKTIGADHEDWMAKIPLSTCGPGISLTERFTCVCKREVHWPIWRDSWWKGRTGCPQIEYSAWYAAYGIHPRGTVGEPNCYLCNENNKMISDYIMSALSLVTKTKSLIIRIRPLPNYVSHSGHTNNGVITATFHSCNPQCNWSLHNILPHFWGAIPIYYNISHLMQW